MKINNLNERQKKREREIFEIYAIFPCDLFST